MKIQFLLNEARIDHQFFIKEIQLKILPKIDELNDLANIILMNYGNFSKDPELDKIISSLPKEEESKLSEYVERCQDYKDSAEQISNNLGQTIKFALTNSYNRVEIQTRILQSEQILTSAIRHVKAFVRYFVSKNYISKNDQTSKELIDKYR